jgi:hypothetical protein
MIQKILNIEEACYSSNMNEESLKRKIEDLFEQRNLQVAGRITGDHEFTAYDERAVITWRMPNLKRKAAYLKGKITSGEKGTLIKLRVQPNSALPLFAFVSAIVGLVCTALVLSLAKDEKFLLIIGLVFIALGVIYYPISTLFKNRLRNKVVKHLGLSEV